MQSLVWFDYALAVVATVLASALAWAVASVLPLPNISLVFLAAVLLVAVRSSLGPSLVCAALSFLTEAYQHCKYIGWAESAKVMLDELGIERLHTVIGGSMGAMQSLEWAIMYPDAMKKVAVIAAPAITSADQIATNSIQVEAIMTDPAYADGNYYDAKPGFGPHRGLALARRMALLNYRSHGELNDRFERAWQSQVSPLGRGGRFAVESYLDFHGNKFTRRFDANSYITLVEAMNSHDVGRGRGSVEEALATVKATSLVAGIDSDRCFPIGDQQRIANHIGGTMIGGGLQTITSSYGHDGFLIERDLVGPLLIQLLES